MSPETVTEATPTAGLTGNASVQEGSTYTITPSFSDPGGDAVTQWQIDWGDQHSETDGPQGPYSHVYNTAGSMSITVTAFDEDGQYSNQPLNPFSVNVIGTTPSNPTNLAAAGPAGAVVVTWTAPNSQITTYQLQRSIDGSNSGFTDLTYSGTTPRFTDTTAIAGATYWYQVRSVNGGSSPQGFATMNAPLVVAPSTPTGISWTATSSSISLTWTAPHGATSYTVQRKGPLDSGYTTIGSPTSPSFTDANAAPGTTYSYQIIANNTGGNSAAATQSAWTAPGIPANVAATVSGSQVNVAWSVPSGTVTAYHVERSANGSDSGFTELAGNLIGTGYTDSTASPGGTYWYRVRAENAGEYSDYGTTAGNSPVTLAPAAPAGLAVSSLTPLSLTLGWTAATGATSYSVWREAPGTTSFVQIATTTGSSFTDQGLSPGAIYQYQIGAANGAGSSPLSSPLSVTIQSPPSPAGDITLSASASPSVSVSWATFTGTLSGYHVERSVDGVNFTEIAGGLQSTGYTDNTVAAGQTYSYRVRADLDGAYSTYTPTEQITLVPPAPTGLSVAGTTQNSAGLTWAAAAGATSYDIYRENSGSNTFAKVGSSPTPSYTDAGLTSGSTYYYSVEAVDSAGPSAQSSSVPAVPAGTPGAPANLTDTILAGPQVSLSWASSGTVSNYHVERSTDGITFLEIAGTVQGTTYVDTTAPASGGTFYYRVRADLNGSLTGYSNVINVAPAPPTGLALTLSGSSVSLTWTGTTGATGYHVERSTDGQNFSELYPPPTGTSTSYTDTTTQPGATYTYRVRADDSGFYSGYTNTQQVTLAPAAPTNLLAIVNSSNQINLTWEPSVGATSYLVMRASAGQSSFTTIGTATSPQFTDNTAVDGTGHLYEVIAVNAAGNSPASTSVAPLQTLTPVVLGRWAFYNNSSFDGNSDAINSSDDAAIDPTKQALLPGQASGFANYTSFSNGLNGVMIDVANLPGTPTAADFTFTVGTAADTSTWASVSPSAVSVRSGAGVDGSSRIEITFADGSIRNEWLKVIVAANSNTGLAIPDTFYFGSLLGSYSASIVNGQYTVGSNDMNAARNDPHTFLSPAPITDPCDYNRDGQVDALDQLIARNNYQSSPAPFLPVFLGSPGMPYLVGASATQIQIGWPASSDPSVTSYDVYRGGQLLHSGVTGLTYTDLTVAAGASYTYTVVSRDANGDSSIPSAALSVTAATAGSAPSINPISGISIVEGQTASIFPTFSDSDSGDTHTATIDWGDGTVTPGTVNESGHTIAASHAYATSDLYVATITLTDQNGGKTTSSFAVSVFPKAPTALIAGTPGLTSVQLNWTDNSQSATQYVVNISYDGVNWYPEQTLGQSANAFLDTSLTDGGTYYFEAVAEGPGGVSAPSNVVTVGTPYATPTITAGPTVDANPETGTSAQLSVMATDPGGGSGLTYDWVMLSGPANANPLISYGTTDDGTESGQHASVTFDMVGSYTFQVTVANGTATKTASVSVTVNQTASSIDIEPGPVELQPSATQNFTATVLDQFGNPMSSQPQFAWSVGSGAGTIDQTGLFTAPAQVENDIVTAGADGLSSQTTALVTGGLYQVTITGRSYESNAYIGESSGDLTVTNTGWISAASPADAVLKAVTGTVNVLIYSQPQRSFPADCPEQEGFGLIGLPTTRTTQQSTGQIGLWDGDPNAPGDYDFFWNVVVAAQPLPPKLRSLKFTGTSPQTVRRDHGPQADIPYDLLRQWRDGNLNGVVDGRPSPGGVIDTDQERQYPLSYARSTPNSPDIMKISPLFAAPLAAGAQIEATTSYNGIMFGPVTANAGGSCPDLIANQPLPSTIDSTDLQTLQR